jgi:hypothetical protein
MENNHTNSPKSFKQLDKDRQKVVQYIRTLIENATEKPVGQILIEYSDINRYYLALQYVTTSNKAVCEAMEIPVEAGTWYKADLENTNNLVASKDLFRCPYTGEMVHFLSTNPAEFERLWKTSDTQLKMF